MLTPQFHSLLACLMYNSRCSVKALLGQESLTKLYHTLVIQGNHIYPVFAQISVQDSQTLEQKWETSRFCWALTPIIVDHLPCWQRLMGIAVHNI